MYSCAAQLGRRVGCGGGRIQQVWCCTFSPSRVLAPSTVLLVLSRLCASVQPLARLALGAFIVCKVVCSLYTYTQGGTLTGPHAMPVHAHAHACQDMTHPDQSFTRTTLLSAVLPALAVPSVLLASANGIQTVFMICFLWRGWLSGHLTPQPPSLLMCRHIRSECAVGNTCSVKVSCIWLSGQLGAVAIWQAQVALVQPVCFAVGAAAAQCTVLTARHAPRPPPLT